MIDIHSHLDICEDCESMIERAKKMKILTCGVDVKTNRKVLEIAEKFPNVFACLGVYPTDALKMSEDEIAREIKFIRKNKDKILGIGEVGMDFKENGTRTLNKQKENLRKFVLLAKDLNKPIPIHSRRAEKETIELLEEIGYNKIIMHCFNGNMKLVQKIIDNGWSLSIPTCVKHSQHFQKVIEMTPIEQLFCETDSPFLHPDKGFPNEPANVIESYKKISEIKDLGLKEVEKKIDNNFEGMFLR